MTENQWRVFLSLQGDITAKNVAPRPDAHLSSVDNVGKRLQGEKIVERFPLAQVKNVLVIGAIGSEVKSFATLGYQSVRGVSAIQADVLQSKNAGYGIIDCADFHTLDCYGAGMFDAVYSHHTFEHAVAPLCLLTSVRRVLKDNGLLFFVVPLACDETPHLDKPGYAGQHYTLFDRPVWKHLLNLSGFSMRDVPPSGANQFYAQLDKKRYCPGSTFEKGLTSK